MTLHRATPESPRVTPRVWLAACLAAVPALAACDALSDDESETVSTADAGTVAVGELPGAVSDHTLPPSPPERTIATDAPSTTEAEVIPSSLGQLAEGNRVIVIGDSSLVAATDSDDELCGALGPSGWAVELAVSSGEPVEYAQSALEQRLADTDRPPVDAIVLGLDNLDEIEPESYIAELDAFVTTAATIPMGVLTLAIDVDDAEEAEFNADINAYIRDELGERANVLVIEWADVAAEAAPGVLIDGADPTADGAATQVELIADALGEVDGLSQCIDITG